MKITFLGTGTSQGVPIIACSCEVCSSNDLHNKRLRASILIEYDNKTVCVDTGPDFRQQMLREKVQSLDAVVYTHEHKDHIAGLDDVRAFNYKHQRHMDIYLSDHVEKAIKREFQYIFEAFKYPGIPLINLHKIDITPFDLFGKTFIPIEVYHYKLPVFGYRIDDFVYVTDAKTIESSEIDKIRGCKVLVLNALRHESHVSHLTLEEAIAIANEIKPEKTYFTHISHQLGLHERIEKSLPQNMHLAYDGLQIKI